VTLGRIRTQYIRLSPLLGGLKAKRPAILRLGLSFRAILDDKDDKSLTIADRVQARDVAKSLLELASALSYAPCPSCLSACADWIVKQQPCGEIHESQKEGLETKEQEDPPGW
jgi:hypothetical protein